VEPTSLTRSQVRILLGASTERRRVFFSRMLSGPLCVVAFLFASRASASLCSVTPGLNCWGNDLGDAGVAANATACCALCAAWNGCRAWTWDQGEGNPPKHCWVKSSCAGAIIDPLAISGSADPLPVTTLCDPLDGWNCFHSDIEDGGVVPSAAACCSACQALHGCNAWTWNGKSDLHCWYAASLQSSTLYNRSTTERSTVMNRFTPPPSAG
jgi:hypothetical protein